jgi:DNA-binding LacI/PurR family transcriptional regulator
VGFDDIEQAGWSSYRLTTFAPPIDRLARRVADLLSKTDDDSPTDGKRTILQADFVWRSTVRPGFED